LEYVILVKEDVISIQGNLTPDSGKKNGLTGREGPNRQKSDKVRLYVSE
jgi:hypothetical protein